MVGPASKGLRVLRSSALALFLTGIAVAGTSEGASGQRLKGTLRDGQYTSSRSLFSVPVPKASNWAGVPFRTQDQSETREGNFDMVVFYVEDFGEVLLASVRHIPQVALENMARDDPQNVSRNLARKALGDWRHNLAEEPDLEEELFVSTAYGQAALHIYRVPKGSLLQRIAGSGSESFDVLIAVIAVKRNDHMISAIAERDYEPLEKERLRARLQGFFSDLAVTETPRFGS